MGRILVVWYSQSGQLTRAVESFVAPLEQAGFTLVRAPIRPRADYPFPWSFWQFLDVFPESVLGVAPEVEPLPVPPDARFDLIVVAFQAWFLGPSLPVLGLLGSEWRRVFENTPVVTLLVCRDMWCTASEKMKKVIADAGGIHIDNVVVTDPSPPWASFVTTPRWLLTGRQGAFWFFPAAGVPERDLLALERFGLALRDRWPLLRQAPGQPLLRGLGAVTVDRRRLFPELVGAFCFPPWARFIRAAGRIGGFPARRLASVIFVVFLVLSILFAAPASLLVGRVLSPLFRGKISNYVRALRAPSGTPD